MSQNITNMFSPKATDVAYTQNQILKISLICRMDSYKFSHPYAYVDGVEGMTSYGTARVGKEYTIIPAGLQYLGKRYLSEKITVEDINFAQEFSKKHFGRELFAYDAWLKVVTEYGGSLPLIIRAVPEGMPVRGGDAIYTVTCLDKDLAWMSAGFETLIQRGVWYPTTIATQDYTIKKEIKRYYEISGADMFMLQFSLHDFGGRGVTCAEQAEVGGMYHTFNFSGSDTIEGILSSNFYYNAEMSAFSVYATEHSVQCSFGSGREDALNYIRTQLASAKALGLQIISIVLDGFDVYREAELCCTVLRDEIIESGVKVVFRPDSGDMMEVVPRILALQEAAFGFEYTAAGYKKIKYVGIIQGDGVDHLAIKNLLGKVVFGLGYSADCVIFGSGGALLQKCNRDTFKFAQKASAILIDSVWKGIAKDPVTDSGKKSLEGVLTLARNTINGELMNARVDLCPLDSEWEDVMQLVYHTGTLYNETTLDEVRERCKV